MQSEIFIKELSLEKTNIKTAIFDFDGTISTLRCGWEDVMEATMYKHLKSSGLPESELLEIIRNYIDDSMGIQTIYQMDWLAQKVGELCNVTPCDPWEYKDEYNENLLKMVDSRKNDIISKKATNDEFLIRGSIEFLKMLHGKGIDIHIASGTDDADLKKEVELLGVMPYVKSVNGAPYRQKNCSKEAVIKKLLSDDNLSAGNILVVGDGKVEISLGNKAGAITVGIAGDERSKGQKFDENKFKKLKKVDADYIVASFNPLLDQTKA